MPSSYFVQFPSSMETEARTEILELFENHGWETYSKIETDETGLKRTLSGFSASWLHSSKPFFPEISNSCIITKQ